MNTVDIRPAQRRKVRTWGWSYTAVVLVVAGVIAVAPHSAAWALVVLGLPALVIALTNLNMGYGRTVLTPDGIRTRRFLTRHRCSWTEVGGISTEKLRNKSGRGKATYRDFVVIALNSGDRFRLAAPYDTSNARDPQFYDTVNQIKGYYAEVANQLTAQPGG